MSYDEYHLCTACGTCANSSKPSFTVNLIENEVCFLAEELNETFFEISSGQLRSNPSKLGQLHRPNRERCT